MMKLKTELDYVIKQMEKLNRIFVLDYIEKVKNEGSYNNFETRIAFDILSMAVETGKICSWYKDFDCDDKHILTLAKKACKTLGYL